MESIKQKLLIAIKRSNKAYTYYLKDKKYYQAKRIYKANEIVYNLLGEYIFIADKSHHDDIIDYIFHLEDWFEQFVAHEKLLNDSLNLDSCFSFIRKEESPSFPKQFVDELSV